ncbi:MAG: NADH dehydrogenase, partial [uncultured Thermomicrobiales bacterium]
MSAQAGPRTRVLILGGGFGGVATAQGLAKAFKRDRSVEITLVNRDNYFVYVPLLASAAAGSIETLHCVAPLRNMVPGVQFRAEEVLGIDLERKFVTTGSPLNGRERQLPYDHLVLALGNVINLAKLPGVAQHGRTLKTLGDALAIRNHVLQMLEAADIETDPVARREMLTFVVAGGGFSGVEMVGELNDLVRDVVEHYPSIGADQYRVILLHSQDRILPEMSPPLADYTLKQLRKRGVEVRLNVRLAGATPHQAMLQDGSTIATRTLIVAVGNAPPPVLDQLPVRKERGRIVVDGAMQVPGFPGVWALGDNAIVPNGATEGGEPSPPTAQYALRQGKALAKNLSAVVRGGQPKPFAFGGLGLLCLVGHGAGVGELPGGIRVRGRLGWLLWRGVYWAKLPSFGRRVQIGLGWLVEPFLGRDIAQINLARTQSIGQAHYEAGAYIFRQGDPGDQFYLIAAGEVDVIRERSSGEHATLARLGRGEYFGETALLNRGARNASVRCVTPVDVITLGRDDFATLAGTWRQFAEGVQRVSAGRAAAGPATSFFPALGTAPNGLDASSRGDGVPAGAGTDSPARLFRPESGGEVVLDRDLISIGRNAENHIVVADPRVSRRHALIQRERHVYLLEDLGGQNGTWLNGRRITERETLTNGDEIMIGKTRFLFQVAPPTDLSVTGIIRGLDAAPPGGVTQIIQGLDAPRVHDRQTGRDAPPPSSRG